MKYIADDGKLFCNADACVKYEAEKKRNDIVSQELKNIKVFNVNGSNSDRPTNIIVVHALSNHWGIASILMNALVDRYYIETNTKTNKLISENVKKSYTIKRGSDLVSVDELDVLLEMCKRYKNYIYVIEFDDVPKVLQDYDNTYSIFKNFYTYFEDTATSRSFWDRVSTTKKAQEEKRKYYSAEQDKPKVCEEVELEALYDWLRQTFAE